MRTCILRGRHGTLDVSMFMLRGRRNALDGAVLGDVAACHSKLNSLHSTYHTLHFYIEHVTFHSPFYAPLFIRAQLQPSHFSQLLQEGL